MGRVLKGAGRTGFDSGANPNAAWSVARNPNKKNIQVCVALTRQLKLLVSEAQYFPTLIYVCICIRGGNKTASAAEV